MSTNGLILLSDNTHPVQKGIRRLFRHLIDGVVTGFGERTLVYAAERRDYGRARFVQTPGWSGRVHDVSTSLLAAIYHPTVILSAYYGATLGSNRRVYVVYDMIHELLPHYFPPKTPYARRFVAEKRRCLLTGERLIAISYATARDLVTLYPEVDPTRIVVANPGVDASFFGDHPWVGVPPARPYFLYVGQRSAYKNFRLLLEAFGEAELACHCDLRVISSEHGRFTAEEQALIRRYGLEQAVQLKLRVSDAELAAHYQRAVALVYPSEYEGFGLPIIEAMAAGTLVLTSDRSSMPEVGGAVAYYFDPTSASDLALRLSQVFALSATERASRSFEGVSRAREFSWQRFNQTVNATVAPLLQSTMRSI